MLHLAAQAPRRLRPLSSNVRPHRTLSMNGQRSKNQRQKQTEHPAPCFWAGSWPAAKMKTYSRRSERPRSKPAQGSCTLPLAQAARPSAGYSPLAALEQDQGQFQVLRRCAQEFWSKSKHVSPRIRVVWAAAAGAKLPAHHLASDVRPNPSLERTSTGLAHWPQRRAVYHRHRGQHANPAVSAQLKR